MDVRTGTGARGRAGVRAEGSLVGALRHRPVLAVLLVWFAFGGVTTRAGAAPIATGAYLPDASNRPGLIDRYAHLVGRSPRIVSSYKDWSSIPFDSTELNAIWSRGAVPLIAWEPWTSHEHPFQLRRIAAGDFDRYLRRSARSAANWGKPIMVRFAQEMNGNWFPWGRGVDGNTARQFRKAWKHIVDLFRFHGATNVIWVWSPNEDSSGRFQLAPFYPGDQWVDWVALDGFNFGGSEGWPSFTRIFGSSYDRLVALTSRPVMIAETGSSESGGDKAEWVTSALTREAPRFPHLRALVFFDDASGSNDFRVDSSPEALAALRRGLRRPTYRATRAELLSTPASLRSAQPAPEPPDSGYGAPSLLERIGQKLHGAYLVAAIVALLALAAAVAGATTVAWRWKRRRAARIAA